MRFEVLLLVLLPLCAAGCVSQRKSAVCSEIRYRLDHVDYTEEQKSWIEEEWRACERERDSLARVDSVRYGSIYQQFQQSDSAGGDQATAGLP